jgi:hypothetical protein
MVILTGIRTGYNHNNIIPGFLVQVFIANRRLKGIPVFFNRFVEVKRGLNAHVSYKIFSIPDSGEDLRHLDEKSPSPN